MRRRLSWHELRRKFPNAWVELVDCEWSSNAPHPLWAVVRHHDQDRDSLLEKIRASGEIAGALILNVGMSMRLIERDHSAAVL